MRDRIFSILTLKDFPNRTLLRSLCFFMGTVSNNRPLLAELRAADISILRDLFLIRVRSTAELRAEHISRAPLGAAYY